jgi:recombination protein RecT
MNDLTAKVQNAQAPISIQDMIEKSAKELGRALPDHMRPERLARIALTCIRVNPELANCTPMSFLGALFTSAQLGLEPVAGLAYLLPFNNKRKIGTEWKTVKEVQFVMGYKGAAALFYRHAKSVLLSWGVVKEQDEFEYQKGTEAFLKHRPSNGERGAVLGYWVVAELANGGKAFEYMTLKDCMAHGMKHSKTFDKKAGEFYSSSPWKTNPDSMCLKTVLLQLSKLLPLSVELQRAIEADESSRDFRQGVKDVLEVPTTTEWNPEESAKLDAAIAKKEVQ